MVAAGQPKNNILDLLDWATLTYFVFASQMYVLSALISIYYSTRQTHYFTAQIIVIHCLIEIEVELQHVHEQVYYF